MLISSNGILFKGKNKGKTIVRLNTVIITKLKVKSINYFTLPDRPSNKLRVDEIGLGAVYVCDITHDAILDTIFSREESRYNELILEGEVESSDDDSEFNEE